MSRPKAMQAVDKEQHLRQLAEKVLTSSTRQKEVDYLLSQLNLTKEEVIQAFITWDLDPDAYGNEFYESVAARFAMYLKYNTSGSWHLERQRLTTELLKEIPFRNLVDVGFGAPQAYVKDVLLQDRNASGTLLDIYESATQFATALLGFWDTRWEERIKVGQHDMNKDGFVGEYDVYLFQDSIEHADQPSQYLTETVGRAPANARFIFSIPVAVGDHEPSHTIDWANQEAAESWLQKTGLNISTAQSIHPDPQIDVYAQGLGKNYFQLIVSATKN